MDAVLVDDLSKKFGDTLAVDKVSFAVKEGEIFGYLGPNGAGKTTTIRMLTTLVPPTSGSASIFGYDIMDQAYEAKRQFGVVPETSNSYDDLTVWQNLMLSGQLYSMPKAERVSRGEELMSLLGLKAHRDKRSKHLSKGLRRRLVLGMALITSPRLLFLDEPTSGLDVESAKLFREMMSDLVKKGATIFLTTHNIEEASVLCDRVAIIVKGRIVALDSPERLRMTIAATRSITISATEAPANIESMLSSIATVTAVMKEGDKWRMFTSNPPGVLLELNAMINKYGIKPTSINTYGPSLEDVFLTMVRNEGRS
jgi:ABC-2 type transport system ATP-binding protein